MSAEKHYEKYEALAQKIGIESLRMAVATIASPEQIAEAFRSDRNLNNIPLRKWDMIAGYMGGATGSGPTRLSFTGLFTPKNANGLSLAERVCVLKHVALHHPR